MRQLPALLVTWEAIKRDTTLQAGSRGARKILVTKLHPEKEEEATKVVWLPPVGSDKCPVQIVGNIEVAIFTQHATQERHHHKMGTEFYMVLAGKMVIEVENKLYTLSAGDMLVVNPGAVHQVKPEGTEFTCRVITANCGGSSDKYAAGQPVT